MTVIDHSKILDRNIMQNVAQYDLDRKAAKNLYCLLMTWTNINV